jgi:hypothetical protein
MNIAEINPVAIVVAYIAIIFARGIFRWLRQVLRNSRFSAHGRGLRLPGTGLLLTAAVLVVLGSCSVLLAAGPVEARATGVAINPLGPLPAFIIAALAVVLTHPWWALRPGAAALAEGAVLGGLAVLISGPALFALIAALTAYASRWLTDRALQELVEAQRARPAPENKQPSSLGMSVFIATFAALSATVGWGVFQVLTVLGAEQWSATITVFALLAVWTIVYWMTVLKIVRDPPE